MFKKWNTSNEIGASAGLQFILKLISNCAKVFGFDHLREDDGPVLTPRFYFACGIVCIFAVACVYTAVVHRDNMIIAVPNICYFSIAVVQGIPKLYAAAMYYKQMAFGFKFLMRIYETNERFQLKDNIKIMQKTNRYILLVIYMLGLTYVVLAVSLIFVMPAYLYLLYNKIELIMPIQLPYLYGDTIFSYFVLSVFHSVVVTIGLFGSLVSEFSVLTVVMNIYALSSCFQHTITEFNKKMSRNELSDMEMKYAVRNLVLMYNEINEYMDSLIGSYNNILTSNIASSGSNQILLIYMLYMYTWIPAYFLYAALWGQLFLTCSMGTLADILTERYYLAINDIDWYRLPVSSNRMVLLMIIKAQHPQSFKFFGSTPINLSLFVSIMKTSYSVAMLLMRSE